MSSETSGQTTAKKASWPSFLWGSLLGLLGGIGFVLWYLPHLMPGQAAPTASTPAAAPHIDQALAEGRALAQDYKRGR